jgi:hypothetical protein
MGTNYFITIVYYNCLLLLNISLHMNPKLVKKGIKMFKVFKALKNRALRKSYIHLTSDKKLENVNMQHKI